MAEHLDLDSWKTKLSNPMLQGKSFAQKGTTSTITSTSFNFGAFNVRGIRNEWEKECLKRDADRYKIDIAAITETHIKGESNIISLGEYIKSIRKR